MHAYKNRSPGLENQAFNNRITLLGMAVVRRNVRSSSIIYFNQLKLFAIGLGLDSISAGLNAPARFPAGVRVPCPWPSKRAAGTATVQ